MFYICISFELYIYHLLFRFVIRSNWKLAQLNVIPLCLLAEKLPEDRLANSWTGVEDVEGDLVCGTQP